MLMNEQIKVQNIDEAFEYWYNLLLGCKGDAKPKKSRDGDIVNEVINAITVIEDPTRCIMKNNIRKMPIRYAIGELLWYLSGSRNLSEIQKYTKAWDRMSDDGKTVNSNYGYCIQKKFGYNQWEACENELKKDKSSRRAVIHIKSGEDSLDSNDVNCTVCLQFFIRDEKLYLTTYMRSNDLWMGFPYDVFQFTAMQILMSMRLNVELGTYTHIVGSLHLYERDVLKGANDNV